MSPRQYRMTKRAEATEETRRRILEASLALHTTKGVEATTWQDIADRAEVAVGTVYYHFPTYDELVPACSSLGKSRAGLPTSAIFDGLRGRRARVDALVREQVAFYERAQGLHNVLRDADRIPAVARYAEEARAQLRALVELALGKGHTKEQADLIEALLDFRVWESMVERGIGREATIEPLTRLIGCAEKIK